jgi:hypothetical protein
MSLAHKPREPRQKVVLPAKMRSGAAQVDVCIRDVSSRGMLLQAGTPPPRGTYVEILRPGYAIVARVVWAREHRFGVLARERISLASVLDRRSAIRPGPSLLPPLNQGARGRRRSPPAPPDAERSRARSAFFQFAALVLAAGTVAILLARLVYDHLAGMFEAVLRQL